MSRVIVIGGGISGLAAAWFLRRRGIDVTLLEASTEPGGTIRTVQREGYVIDVGPTSTLYRGGALAELINGLNLSGDVVEADRRARRYVVKHNRLLPLPMGPLGFLTTPLFSSSAKLRLLAEPFHGRARDEESIAAFVRRRLGTEFLDWAVDPFVSGVYAGDPERLSIRAATARLYALEAEYGSLLGGALARLFRGRSAAPMPARRLISFRRGMQMLPKAIAAQLGGIEQLNNLAMSVTRRERGWTVSTLGGEFHADDIVLAVPAYRAAVLLAPLAPQAARELEAIAYPPVASVAFGFARPQVGHALDGFGALLPRREQRETLGVIFSSSLFPERAPAGKVLLTAFIGGACNPAAGQYSPALLVDKVLEDLRPLLQIQGEPEFRQVELWSRAIPQYELGYAARLARIEAAIKPLTGLHLCGNWRGGVSLGDSVESAYALAALLGGAN